MKKIYFLIFVLCSLSSCSLNSRDISYFQHCDTREMYKDYHRVGHEDAERVYKLRQIISPKSLSVTSSNGIHLSYEPHSGYILEYYSGDESKFMFLSDDNFSITIQNNGYIKVQKDIEPKFTHMPIKKFEPELENYFNGTYDNYLLLSSELTGAMIIENASNQLHLAWKQKDGDYINYREKHSNFVITTNGWMFDTKIKYSTSDVNKAIKFNACAFNKKHNKVKINSLKKMKIFFEEL